MSESKFVWYDFMAADVKKALAFYTETAGWKTEEWEGGDSPYTMLKVGDRHIGGVMQLPEEAAKMGAPPHWLGYVGVEDVDASVEKAKSLGGQVYNEPTDIPEVGRFAVIADPQGATFCVFSSSSEDGMEPVDPQTPGAISWHELYTSDLEGGWEFYTELFGWDQTDTMDMGEMGEYRMFGQGEGQENTWGGFMQKPDEMPMSFWMYYVTVDNIDDAVERVKSNGGQVQNGPMEIPGGGKVAQFSDNQGGMFAFYQPAEG